ncbi:uncharacterized protein BO87DRAFT_427913 [Aspergillus neoniger CBS 115656]|uniref:Uncharacterized protein n=1 Tax=Aspergillus neoniger (strain CBS 115656) TaxID=1448310 RepID=A0A318YEQ1_ASPNB|nr:hypothetical protein BO87DRAFT_427913 [Aspergillus neoniger CBS 115656]PYH32107.1 hypothetical protein BO87DRAFT_427913 [Aspergillus neoniger CBS 115656]
MLETKAELELPTSYTRSGSDPSFVGSPRTPCSTARGGEIKESGASTILASRRATKANWPDKSSYFLFPATLLQRDSSGPCPPENGVSAVLFLFEKSIRMSSCTHSHVNFESDGIEGPPVMFVSDDMFKRGTGRCCVRSSTTTSTTTNNGKVYHFLDVQELK